MRRWIVLLAFITIILSSTTAANAAAKPAGVGISNIAVFYTYGSQVTFQATFEPANSLQIKAVKLYLLAPGQNTRVIDVQPNQNGELLHQLDIEKNPLRPFASIEYWYQIETVGNEPFESAHYSFFYEDNRFEWQHLESSQFIVNWIDGGTEFGQDVLTAAEQGLASVSNLLPVKLPAPIRIYVYPTATDLQSALEITTQSWVAGHASPDLGVILVSIPTGIDQRIELERQIPHELMHLAQYQAVTPQYASLPVWLSEGMASLAEVYPNPDFQSAMDQAVEKQSLLPISDLCQSFPREASGAFLAYAQSESFVRFLQQNYGQKGMAALLIAYQNNLGCAEGVNAAFNIPLAQLEFNWHQSLTPPSSTSAGSMAVKDLAPYLALAGILLVPAVLVSFLLAKRTS
jgi:hypothetical protein